MDLSDIIERAKQVAIDYRRATGKPLGITGEIGEYEAARLLGLRLALAREPGYDAVDDRTGRKYQIKSRALSGAGKRKSQRVPNIKIDCDWGAALLVLMDESFNVEEIWEADRAAVISALEAPGSRARNERGALAVAKFKSIGRSVWRSAATRETSS